MKLLLASLWLLLAFSGCSSTSVSGVGSSVLRGFGAEPAPVASAPTASVEAMADLQNITQENEYFIGRTVAAKLLSLYPLVDDEVLTQYLNKAGQAAVAFSARPEIYGGYRFGILESEEINAVAAPGGFIFVSRGLLKILPDEDALVAVLAHEVTHVSERHALKRISDRDLSAAFAAAGVVGGALTCNEALAEASLVLGVISDKILKVLLEKGYSREQEYEADAGSVRILTRAGYDASGIITVLNQLDTVRVNSSGGWFKTHPSNKERRIALQGVLNRASNQVGKTSRTERFQRIFGTSL